MLSPRNRVVLLSVLLLASCASVAPGPQRILPPADLLQTCQEPVGDVRTNGGLVRYIQALREALWGCNRDKEALRDWASS
jgi:hypothetical protein